MYGAVIGGKVVWIVDKDCPNSFYFKGGWYVLDKYYLEAHNWYSAKNCRK